MYPYLILLKISLLLSLIGGLIKYNDVWHWIESFDIKMKNLYSCDNAQQKLVQLLS